MLKIRGWNETFENAKTRKLMHMEWLHVPSGVDSAGYLELMGLGTDGIIAFAVFTAICQWSATCRPNIRGSLARSDGKPLTIRQLSVLLRMPPDVVSSAIGLLSHPDVGWLIDDNTEKPNDLGQSANHPPVVSQPSATHLPIVSVQGEEGKGLEGNGGDRIGRDWNRYTPGDEIVIHNSVNTPECWEAAGRWFRHMDERGHPEDVPVRNSQAEQDFWAEAYRMGPEKFIDAVQYSIGKIRWLSIHERPEKPAGRGNGAGNHGSSNGRTHDDGTVEAQAARLKELFG